MPENSDAAIKRMAELLRRGATMLAESCPNCGAPLFKVKDKVYCASCDRRFGPEPTPTDGTADEGMPATVVSSVRTVVSSKIEALLSLFEKESNLDALAKTAELLSVLLDILVKVGSKQQ